MQGYRNINNRQFLTFLETSTMFLSFWEIASNIIPV